MSNTAVQYEIEQFYPGFDIQRFWDLFVDHAAWSASDALPGVISIVEPGDGAEGARLVLCGRRLQEDRILDRYAPHFEGDNIYDSRWLASQTVPTP